MHMNCFTLKLSHNHKICFIIKSQKTQTVGCKRSKPLLVSVAKDFVNCKTFSTIILPEFANSETAMLPNSNEKKTHTFSLNKQKPIAEHVTDLLERLEINSYTTTMLS